MREELVIEDKQDVLDAFKEIRKEWGGCISDNLLLIEKEIDSIRYRLDRMPADRINWVYVFKNLCNRMMDLISINDFDREALAILLVEKHLKYGPAALTKWGAVGILIRIDSKLQRAKNLKLTEAYIDPSDLKESLSDTMNDMVGYCVLGFIIEKRKRV